MVDASGSAPPLPWMFFLVAIVVAAATGAFIAYLGLTGHLGGGIPGSRAPGSVLYLIPGLGLIAGPLTQRT